MYRLRLRKEGVIPLEEFLTLLEDAFDTTVIGDEPMEGAQIDGDRGSNGISPKKVLRSKEVQILNDVKSLLGYVFKQVRQFQVRLCALEDQSIAEKSKGYKQKQGPVTTNSYKRVNIRKPMVSAPTGNLEQNKVPPRPERNVLFAGIANGAKNRKRRAAGKGVLYRPKDFNEDGSSDSEPEEQYAYQATHGPPGVFPKLTISSGGVTRAVTRHRKPSSEPDN